MRHYNGWTIEKVGGHITITRFIARKGEKRHWAFTLKDCKLFCDIQDNGGVIHKLYLQPLYA